MRELRSSTSVAHACPIVTLESQRAKREWDDIRGVIDAAHFEDGVLVGISEGIPMSVLFAARYPTRTRRLVLYGGAKPKAP